MMSETALINLQKRNSSLKSRLVHEQLKHGSYQFKNFKRESLQVLSEYKTHKSIFKAALSAGINHQIAIKWFIQGQMGNPHFRDFYCGISRINNLKENADFESSAIGDDAASTISEFEGDYKISEYGDGWSYTTYIGGEKIFIISNELDTLKKKVADKRLPLN